MVKKGKNRLIITLKDEQIKWLSETADKFERTKSQYISYLINQAMKKYPTQNQTTQKVEQVAQNDDVKKTWDELMKELDDLHKEHEKNKK